MQLFDDTSHGLRRLESLPEGTAADPESGVRTYKSEARPSPPVADFCVPSQTHQQHLTKSHTAMSISGGTYLFKGRVYRVTLEVGRSERVVIRCRSMVNGIIKWTREVYRGERDGVAALICSADHFLELLDGKDSVPDEAMILLNMELTTE